MEIKIKRLQRFVKTLQSMEQDMPIDMDGALEPRCGTPGCHAGLVMLALDKMGLKQTEYYLNEGYDYCDQADRLARYLFASKKRDKSDLENWAFQNPKIWGNQRGLGLFVHGESFGQTTDSFPSSVIVDHWAGVLDRLTERRKAS